MAKMTVGDLRKIIEGLPDDIPVGTPQDADLLEDELMSPHNFTDLFGIEVWGEGADRVIVAIPFI